MAKKGIVKKITGGLFTTATDFLLFSLDYGFEVTAAGFGGLTFSGTRAAGRRAIDKSQQIDSKTIKRALRQLQDKGLVQFLNEKTKEHIITKQGKKRLGTLLPKYQNQRSWDGIIYAVTYDIPVTHNNDRNMLREFLRRIGCGLLQESVWITPYNPTSLIRVFANDRGLEGSILVSSLGKGGAIGSMSLEELIEKVYDLKILSYKYEQFISSLKNGEFNFSHAAFLYLSILRDDPQLPFEILPDWWAGDRAYEVFQERIKQHNQHARA